MREHLSAAGDNALEDCRRATSGLLEGTCSQAINDSRRGAPGEETQTSQSPTTFTTGPSRHHPLLKQSQGRSQGRTTFRVYPTSSSWPVLPESTAVRGGCWIDPG